MMEIKNIVDLNRLRFARLRGDQRGDSVETHSIPGRDETPASYRAMD